VDALCALDTAPNVPDYLVSLSLVFYGCAAVAAFIALVILT
jgi:hypothetical protein